jgi:hypothetical protein
MLLSQHDRRPFKFYAALLEPLMRVSLFNFDGQRKTSTNVCTINMNVYLVKTFIFTH